MADDFSLTPSGEMPRQNGGKRPGAGRPRGKRAQVNEQSWKRAGKHWPEVLEGIVLHALRVKEMSPPKTAMQAALWLGDRFFPEPRGTPIAVNIAQLGGAALVEGVQTGDLTPADAAALIRARSQTIDVSPADSNQASARDALRDRLLKALNNRSGNSPAA